MRSLTSMPTIYEDRILGAGTLLEKDTSSTSSLSEDLEEGDEGFEE